MGLSTRPRRPTTHVHRETRRQCHFPSSFPYFPHVRASQTSPGLLSSCVHLERSLTPGDTHTHAHSLTHTPLLLPCPSSFPACYFCPAMAAMTTMTASDSCCLTLVPPRAPPPRLPPPPCKPKKVPPYPLVPCLPCLPWLSPPCASSTLCAGRRYLHGPSVNWLPSSHLVSTDPSLLST